MVTSKKPTGLAMSIPAGLAWGAAWSMGMTLILTAVTAKLLDLEMIAQEQTGYGVMIILTVSALTGALAAGTKIQRRLMLVSLLSGGVYYGLLLLITALFFGGNYSGAGETGLMVVCGSLLALMWQIREKKPRKYHKIKKANC